MELRRRRRRRKSLTMCARKWHKSPHNRFKPFPTSEELNKKLLEEHQKRSQQKQIVTYRAKRNNIVNKSTLEPKLFILTFALLSLIVLLAASSFVISATEQVVVSAAAAATTTTSQPPINSSPTTTTTTAKTTTAAKQQHKSITDDKSIFTTRQQTVTSGGIKPSQRQVVEEQAVKRLSGPASVSLLPSTTTTTTSSSSSSTKLEEEVELSRATAERASASAKRRQRQPRIYKLSTNPLNGKLSLPLRISINDGLLSRPLNQRPGIIGNVDKVGPSSSVMAIREQQQQQQPQQPQTTTTQAPFGTRAQKVVSVIGDNNSSNETTEACLNPEQNQEHGSIATSSQTLRLTKAERPKMLQVPGFQVRNGGSHQSSSIGSSSSIIDTSSPGEVEEFSGSLKVEPIERAQPTLIATPPTSSILSQNRKQEIGRKNTQPTNVHLAELSIEEPTSTQSVTSSSVSASSNTNESNERANSNSILSLIDDYDSKIITNRTKAQLSCDSGEMILRLNFSEPFKGIVYPDHNRLSPCRFFGDGHHNYELRLPLRGCGTRQAAPRVFVNDVIVRFHKALELEEDEVKTLICRYPPPLAPVPLENGAINSNLSSNNQVFGNYRDRANSNKQTLDQTNDGSNSEQESQFEFIDSLNGKLNSNINNKLPEPGTTGQIETLSENLVVAPPVGQQTHYGQQINPSSSPDDVLMNPFLKPNQNLKQRPDFPNLPNEQQPPIDIFNQRNSIISPNFNQNAANGGFSDNVINSRGSGAGSASTNAQSYFERFSSIELLFLISSLMFLVLLALGLVGSYYCFRRQVNQNKQNRASAILRRKHRYLNSLDHRHNHGATLINPPTILQPPTNKYSSTTNTALRQQQQQQHHHHHHHLNLDPALHQQRHHYSHHYQLPRISQQQHQHHHSSNSTATPSPDSDLSGQNLIIEPKGSQRFTGGSGGHENRAFLSNGNSFSTPDNHYQGNSYRASSGGGILVKQPVVGRRNTTHQQHYGYGSAIAAIPGHSQVRDVVVSGRQQRHLSPMRTVVQYPTKKSAHDGPLLSEGYPINPGDELIGDEEEPEYSNTTRSLRFKDSNRGFGSKIGPATGASLIPAKYAFVNKARAKLATNAHSSGNKRLDEDSSSYYARGDPSSAQLWRAKSMSAVNKDNIRFDWQQKGRQVDKMSQATSSGLVFPLGGTLSRHEHSGGRNNYRRRQPPAAGIGGSQSILTSEDRSRFNDMNYYSSHRAAAGKGKGKGLLMKDAGTIIDSDDNGSFSSDEQNNNLSEILMQEKPMSNIVLKSIEDAYITSFTEIYEQEYMKRDSTRPLALSEWRSMQPRAKINNNSNNNNHLVGNQQNVQQQQARMPDNDNDTESSSGRGGKLVSTQTTSDEDDEEQRYQSTGVTNLRSLTELDVNFAKSLPTLTNPAIATLTRGDSSPPLLKAAASFDRILVGNVNDNAAEELLNEEGRKQRSNSVPEVRINKDETTSGDGKKSAKTEEKNSKTGVVVGRGGIFALERQDSPDLILSPDYDYNRLEFEPPDEASKSSHNSVSYV